MRRDAACVKIKSPEITPGFSCRQYFLKYYLSSLSFNVCMYEALMSSFLRATDFLVKACLVRNCLIAPVLSNFLLKRFRTRSIDSPSLIGIINICFYC